VAPARRLPSRGRYAMPLGAYAAGTALHSLPACGCIAAAAKGSIAGDRCTGRGARLERLPRAGHTPLHCRRNRASISFFALTILGRHLVGGDALPLPARAAAFST